MFVNMKDATVNGNKKNVSARNAEVMKRLYQWLCYGLFVVAVAFIMVGVYSKVGMQHPQSNVANREYVVKPGDTLYSIALRFRDGQDLNQYLFQLEQEVPSDARIYPGEVITLPSP